MLARHTRQVPSLTHRTAGQSVRAETASSRFHPSSDGCYALPPPPPQLFYTGTATEVMPIRSLDRITICEGTRGPVTERLQRRYQDIINGRAEDVFGWLSTRDHLH